MKRTAALVVAVVAASALVAGCASSGESTGTLPPIATTTSTTTIPETTTTLPDVYVVQAGENISQIAQKLGVSLDDLLALNGIVDRDHIERGQKLKVPKPGVVIPTTTTSSTIQAETTTLA